MSRAMTRFRALLLVLAVGLVPTVAACMQGEGGTKLNPQPLPPSSSEEERNDQPSEEGTSAGADMAADAGADAKDGSPE
jgi:hypothetical protein